MNEEKIKTKQSSEDQQAFREGTHTFLQTNSCRKDDATQNKNIVLIDLEKSDKSVPLSALWKVMETLEINAND